MRIVGVVVAAALLLASSSDAFAQPRPPPRPGAHPPAPVAKRTTAESLPDDLRPIYEKAVSSFHLGDSESALPQFQMLYDRTHDPRLLWNIALCQKNLRRFAKAIATLQRYIAATGDNVTDQDRRDAADLIQSYAPNTTAATLNVSERDADLWLDDEPLGKTPLATSIVVDRGPHKVRAQKEGFRTFDKSIEIQGAVGGVPTEVNVQMERLSGRLELQVPSDATTTVDDRDVGHGPTIGMELPIGPHVVKVTAVKMRPYQATVQLEDGKTQALTIVLERDAEQFAELRVAVGCGDEVIRTPDRHLSVYLDGSTLSAQPLGVRLRSGPDDPAFVGFSVSPGPHEVRVAVPGCQTLSVSTVAAPERPAAVSGILPPETPFFNGSPAGTPSGLHVGLGWDWSTLSFGKYYDFFSLPTFPTGTSPGSVFPAVTANVTGPSATIGTVGRWWQVVFDVRYLFGSTSGPQAGSIQQFDTGVRAGPRIPLYYAVLTGGLGGSFGYFSVTASANNQNSGLAGGSNGVTGRAFGWAALDVRPLCDWGLEAGWQQSFINAYVDGSDSGAQGETTFFLHALYQPNALCSRSHAGLFQLDGTGTLAN